MTNPLYLGLLICFLIGNGQIRGQTDAGGTAEVTVLLRDYYGHSLPRGKITVRTSVGALVYSEEAQDAIRVRLPYGHYKLFFEGMLYEPASREFTVREPEQLVVLAAHPERFILDAPNEPISITVKVYPVGGCSISGAIWLRLVGTFSDYAAERFVKPSGEIGVALFESVQAGSYVLMIVEGEKVRAVQAIDAKKMLTDVDIHLAGCGGK